MTSEHIFCICFIIGWFRNLVVDALTALNKHGWIIDANINVIWSLIFSFSSNILVIDAELNYSFLYWNLKVNGPCGLICTSWKYVCTFPFVEFTSSLPCIFLLKLCELSVISYLMNVGKWRPLMVHVMNPNRHELLIERIGQDNIFTFVDLLLLRIEMLLVTFLFLLYEKGRFHFGLKYNVSVIVSL
jgi:hypothetical protein